MRRLPPHLPRTGPSSRAGRNWHLPLRRTARAAVAGASSGRVPLPLWMSGTPRTVPSPRRATSPRQDVAVSTRIVYTDLDGTMVGPRGSFWHTADRDLTDDPAAALLELHRAGIPLVLVSGRTFEQVIEAARIFAADGAIAELGATGRLGRRPRHPPAAGRAARGVRGPDADGGHGRARHRRGAARRAPRAAGVARPLAHHARRRRPAARPGRPARRRRVAGAGAAPGG